MAVRKDLADSIGRTPLVHLRRASERTGCTILAKAEFLNPGGSIKDRTALGLLRDAQARGLLQAGTTIVEGTAGNTGIGLALVGASLGCRTIIVMPQTMSREKIAALRMIGAEVQLVPVAPWTDPNHYASTAMRIAEEMNAQRPASAWFAGQFDNPANLAIHEATTGVEIWEETGGAIDGFACAAGTGGTIAGVGRALKARKPDVRIALADPAGSALANWINTGELAASGTSISEGIGISRLTENFRQAPIDLAWSIADEESIPLAHALLAEEGWCVGGSSGVNMAGAIRLARELGRGHTVVTVLADAGTRYPATLFDPATLRARGIPVPAWLDSGDRAS